VNAAVQSLNIPVSGISVKLSGGTFGLFANQFDFTFTYIGDGSDVVANIVGPINDALNAIQIGTTFDYVGATSSSSGISTEGQAGNAGVVDLASVGISNTTLILVVIGLALTVFLVSGGAGVVRRATGA
jgi:hypothetical protein